MKRDSSLDIVKGFACVLMVLAHPKTMGLTVDNNTTTLLWSLGFFAPVLFFASTGVSLTYQMMKRPKYKLVLSNALLIFVVFVSSGFKFDFVITSLAISSLLAMFLVKWNGVLLIAGVKLADVLLDYFAPAANQLHGSLASVIPWLGFLLLGDYLYKNKKLILPTCLIFSCLSVSLIAEGIWFNGQSPSTLFITAGLAVYSFSLLLAPRMEKFFIGKVLSFLGENTLMFWWTHFFIMGLVFTRYKLFAPYTWILLFASSSIFIYLARKLNDHTFIYLSDKILFWLLLPGAFVTLQLFRVPGTPYINRVLLFIFALNYHNFVTAVDKTAPVTGMNAGSPGLPRRWLQRIGG